MWRWLGLCCLAGCGSSVHIQPIPPPPNHVLHWEAPEYTVGGEPLADIPNLTITYNIYKRDGVWSTDIDGLSYVIPGTPDCYAVTAVAKQEGFDPEESDLSNWACV